MAQADKSRHIIAANEIQPFDKSKLILAALGAAIEQSPPLDRRALFGFNALVQTPTVILSNTDFDFEFDIPFDDDMEANEATITIYNLSDDTANRFKVGNSTSITAGYGSDTGIIFSGWISKVKTAYDGVDRITTIYALDDAQYSPQMLNEVTYAEGTKASKILKDLLDRLGLPIAVFKPQRDHTYDSETKVDGSIVESIKEYSDVCGVSTYVYKQQIYCRPIWDGDNLRFSVTEDTGMIGSPEPFEEKNDSEEYTDHVTGYNVTMLLQHRLTTAGIVKIISKNNSGEYRIVSGSHKFDGLSATTEFKAIENITTTVNQQSS